MMAVRAHQLTLLTDTRTWRDIPAPTNALGEPNEMYTEQWRSITTAADDLGWSPADITQQGTEAFAQALTNAGLRDWDHNTITRYAKLLRYAGIDQTPHPSPIDVDSPDINPTRLWATDSPHPATNRNTLLALITWHWNVPLSELHELTVKRVTAHHTGILTIDTDTTIPHAGLFWERWRPHLTRYDSPWVWATTRPGPHQSQPGQRLSRRGLQYAFTHHAQAVGYQLNWQQYHQLATHHQPHPTSVSDSATQLEIY